MVHVGAVTHVFIYLLDAVCVWGLVLVVLN